MNCFVLEIRTYSGFYEKYLIFHNHDGLRTFIFNRFNIIEDIKVGKTYYIDNGFFSVHIAEVIE